MALWFLTPSVVNIIAVDLGMFISGKRINLLDCRAPYHQQARLVKYRICSLFFGRMHVLDHLPKSIFFALEHQTTGIEGTSDSVISKVKRHSGVIRQVHESRLDCILIFRTFSKTPGHYVFRDGVHDDGTSTPTREGAAHAAPSVRRMIRRVLVTAMFG
ncbi:unnamed protein product [Cercospora beticola]|nr:unnamed protein product [Cercospora beticola]